VKNVLFIDKALPPKSVNAREKMYRYFKKVVKQFVFKVATSNPPKKEGNIDLNLHLLF